MLVCLLCGFQLAVGAQKNNNSSCIVNWRKQEIIAYSGGCDRNHLASGKGEAKGSHRYTESEKQQHTIPGEHIFADSIAFRYAGNFSQGFPDGVGEYFLGDSLYFKGHYQLGLKEGQGELHYLRKNKPDSVVLGYWSGDEFRGEKYKTYNLMTTGLFDQVEVVPTPGAGNTITIELSTTSGTPNGSLEDGQRKSGVLLLSDLMSPTNSIVKRTSVFQSSNKTYYTYELLGFPCKLFGTLSTGDTFELELYKAANWKFRVYLNR